MMVGRGMIGGDGIYELRGVEAYQGSDLALENADLCPKNRYYRDESYGSSLSDLISFIIS